MNKEEIIAKYGEEAWQRHLEQRRIYHKEHKEQEKARSKRYREDNPEEVKAYSKRYNEENPEQVKANNHEGGRKGGKYYETKSEYKRTGLQGNRNKIRNNHARQYKPYKQIIAPDSQIHHEWVPNTSEYRGVALVEADQHMHGIVDVIEILDGKITLLTEEEVKRGKNKMKEEEKERKEEMMDKRKEAILWVKALMNWREGTDLRRAKWSDIVPQRALDEMKAADLEMDVASQAGIEVGAAEMLVKLFDITDEEILKK